MINEEKLRGFLRQIASRQFDTEPLKEELEHRLNGIFEEMKV